MANCRRPIVVMLAWVVLWSACAVAGMPSATIADVPPAVEEVRRTGLTDLARQRLEVISFFLLGLMACAGVIRWVWNGLRKDFPILPRLSISRAFGVIVLWGLLFILVLTMISGARELMTPGAWEKKGLTYRLVQSPSPPVEAEISARYRALNLLGDRLVAYAKGHGGAFPTAGQAGEVDESLWQVPSPPGGRYHYVGGRLAEDFSPTTLLVYEPESAGADRLVLMTDRSIRWMPASEVESVLSTRKP